ncbi:MAG: hypothetical protein VYC89_01160 [Actinomycetota bacterium]|nr:hypothetical protein [Actinomycetota bacterium]
MSTPVIVFRRIESISAPLTLQWITEFSKKSPIIFASDNDEFPANNFFENHGLKNATYIQIDTGIPIEVQEIYTRLPEDILYILLDVEASASAISYRTPCVWLPIEERDIPSLQAVEVLRRASWVLGTEELRKKFDIDHQYFRNVSSTSVEEIVDLCIEAKIRQPDDVFHGLLLAEILHRDHLLEESFNNLKEDLPDYLYNSLELRISSQVPDGLSGVIYSDREDRKGEIISSYLSSNDQLLGDDRGYKPVGLLENISGICSSESLRELLQLYEREASRNSTEVSLKLIYQAIAKEFSSKHLEVLLEFPDFFDLLPSSEFVPSLSLQEVIKIIQIPEIPETILKDFETMGSYFVSLAGRLALHSRKAHEDISSSEIEELVIELEKIDSMALYEGLWLTGLRFWSEMAGMESKPHPESFDEPEIIQIDSKYKPNEVAALDRRARRYLSIGLYGLSCRTFEIVRSAAKSNRQFSTELAARLNIGWALWAQGKSREIWEPYIASTLNEVGPSKDLVDLRIKLDDFLRANRQYRLSSRKILPSRKERIRRRSQNLLVFVRKNPVLAVPFLSSIIILRRSFKLFRRIIRKTLKRLRSLIKKVILKVLQRGKAQ